MTVRRTAAADTTRERIVEVTAELLAAGGREAVSTRAVSAAAGVQAPTLYRLFGDKQGLLDAVATRGFTIYLEGKADRELSDDPVEDLRTGWDLHVGFGLANPAVFILMHGEPRGHTPPPAVVAAAEVLGALIHRVAEAGRLRVPEHRAINLLHAAGGGTTLTLIAMPEDRRDMGLSDLARDAVIAAITTDAPVAPQPGPVSAAVALRAALPQTTTLSAPERTLLGEWLDRIADEDA